MNTSFMVCFLLRIVGTKLRRYLIDSPYQLALLRSTKEYLDHCTLLHVSQEKEYGVCWCVRCGYLFRNIEYTPLLETDKLLIK
jgi:hypothetical protein